MDFSFLLIDFTTKSVKIYFTNGNPIGVYENNYNVKNSKTYILLGRFFSGMILMPAPPSEQILVAYFSYQQKENVNRVFDI